MRVLGCACVAGAAGPLPGTPPAPEDASGHIIMEVDAPAADTVLAPNAPAPAPPRTAADGLANHSVVLRTGSSLVHRSSVSQVMLPPGAASVYQSAAAGSGSPSSDAMDEVLLTEITLRKGGNFMRAYQARWVGRGGQALDVCDGPPRATQSLTTQPSRLQICPRAPETATDCPCGQACTNARGLLPYHTCTA